MTGKKFLLILVLQWVIFTLVKIWLFETSVFSSSIFQDWFYWAIVAVVSIALIRRFGIISFFEAIFALFIWIIADLFLDLVITVNFTGIGIYKSSEYWFGYLVMIVGVMVFHKMRHVAIRKELHAKHHGHH